MLWGGLADNVTVQSAALVSGQARRIPCPVLTKRVALPAAIACCWIGLRCTAAGESRAGSISPPRTGICCAASVLTSSILLPGAALGDEKAVERVGFSS